MSDPTPSRRLWPLAAMALLVGLLATFLFVKFTRPADDTPIATSPPPAEPVKHAPPAPAVDPADKLLADAEKALAEGRWEEAGAKAEQVKGPKAPAAARILARIDEARKKKLSAEEQQAAEEARKRREEAAAQEKARLERETALAELDKLSTDADAKVAGFQWDAAVALYEDALKKHPALATVEDFSTARRRVEKLREDAIKGFTGNAERARTELRAGRYASATRLARTAQSLYPENPAGAALLKEISTQMLESNLVPIPATIKGGVKLGDAKQADEPERTFTSPGFLMDKYEVTNEEYHLFVQQTRHRAPPSPHWSGGEPRQDTERFPVTHITAADAEAFAAWAGKRLPTEDEWEYAARWVDARIYPWGNTEPTDRAPVCQSLEAAMVYDPPKVPFLKQVGSWPASASPFGIHDLAGNVWEWTSTVIDGKRILKGGSFLTKVGAARASNRLFDDSDLIHPDVGFRCVKDRP